MNNLDKIIEKINSEAEESAAKITNAAKTEGRVKVEDAENKARDIIAVATRQAEAEKENILVRAKASADMAGRELILQTKVALTDKAYQRALDIINTMHPDDYCTLLAHLLCDSVSERCETVQRLREEYGDEEEYSTDFEVLFNEKDKADTADAVIKKAKTLLKKVKADYAKLDITVSEKTANISGGFILSYGDAETNCSTEAVVSGVRETTEPAVREILFAPVTENE